MFRRLALAFAALATLIIGLTAPAAAQSSGRPGQFDFYVLSLSWSPSYCEAQGDQRRDVQCTRPFGFVVHGLWPQYDRGFPSDCPYAGRLPDQLIKSQLDIFPAFGLVIHEWRKHGTCSGLEPAAYFEAVRKAFASIVIPPSLTRMDKPSMLDTQSIRQDFMAANKGLDANELSVVCDTRRLQEVRICLDRDLKTFHACPQVANSSCRQPKVYLPSIRASR